MRHTLALLLLVAALIHPVIHVDDPIVCGCAHGALTGIAPPDLSGASASTTVHASELRCTSPIAPAAEIPARAPPAA